MEYLLKDVFLGYNDGKKEARYRSDFENFFFDYSNVYENILRPDKYIIIGRKGSGKTILAEYYKKIAKKDPLHFCEIRSYKDFKFHELINLKTNDVSPNEYISIWEWFILLDFARMTLEDNGINNSDLKAKLNRFYKENYYSIDIDTQKIIEITKTNKIKGEAFKIGGEHSKSKKLIMPMYLNYLEDLNNVVFGLLKDSSSQYTIFYDELDDRFKDEDDYKNSIISLLKATDKINLKFLDKGINAKIVVLLRSDIFTLLNDPDLNKIRIDNSIFLDWGHKVSIESPLISLILSKIKKSIPLLKNIDDISLFKLFFPQNIKGIAPYRFLLERTFFRPRDVITYLNFIIEKYPNTKYFGWKFFIDVKKDYSEYFYQEIRNELSGHLEDKEIELGTLILKQFNKYYFTYKEIADYFCKNYPSYKDIDLDKILTVFFKFSIIGNKWYNEFKKRDYYSWSYRDNRATIDFNKLFVIHLGLREELSL